MDIAKLRQKIRETQIRRDQERLERMASPAVPEGPVAAAEPAPQIPPSPAAPLAAITAPPAAVVEAVVTARSLPVKPAETKQASEPPAAAPVEPSHPEAAGPAPEEDVDDYLEEGVAEDSRHREGEAIKILAFRLGDEDYAVRLTDMQEVLMYHDVTRLPRTPAYLLGITSLRGKVIPVIDLRERLGIRGPDPQIPRVLVLKGDDEPVGARVDSVTGVIRTWTDEILPALNTLSEDESRFISGVVRVDGRFVSLLELDEVLRIEIEV